MLTRITSALAVVSWLAVLGFGFNFLARYEFTPGALQAACGDWPEDSDLPHAGDRPTLVVLLHACCPCSRASLAELGHLLDEGPGRVAVHVVFVRPEETPEGWERSALWDQAQTLPGAAVHIDPSGQEARRFGALTSGASYLFDPQGRLLFRGGLTATRGGAGPNAGCSAVAARLAGETTAHAETPVFGCPLFAGAERD